MLLQSLRTGATIAHVCQARRRRSRTRSSLTCRNGTAPKANHPTYVLIKLRIKKNKSQTYIPNHPNPNTYKVQTTTIHGVCHGVRAHTLTFTSAHHHQRCDPFPRDSPHANTTLKLQPSATRRHSNETQNFLQI